MDITEIELKYKHETFGEKTLIEGWYRLFKARVTGNTFVNSLLDR